MPKTVGGAFDIFLTDIVNLDSNQTKTARNSRNWLLEQITLFEQDDTFPKLYQEKNIHYGSFARKTKIRPLDDIDLMVCIAARGSTYTEYMDRIEIIANTDMTLQNFCRDFSKEINSIKVVNKFVSKMKDVPQYSNADIKRNQEAATLKLKSYDWNFDIVPCFITAPNHEGKTYYLIPDGKGKWKKTDPRIDRQRTTDINLKHNGYILNIIRIMKYWAKRPIMPKVSSYLLETLLLNYYDENSECSNYIYEEIPKVLNHIYCHIMLDCNDPKNIQGNINYLSNDERLKVFIKCNEHMTKAKNANLLMQSGEYKDAIEKWSEVFGNDFPKYE